MSRSDYGTLAIKSIAAETTNISQTVPTTTNNGDIWYDTMFKCKENGVVRDLVNPIFTFTTKGDILGFTTTNNIIQAGLDNRVYTVDTSYTSGISQVDIIPPLTIIKLNRLLQVMIFPESLNNTLTYKFVTLLLFFDRIARVNDDTTLTTYTTYTNIEAFLYNEFALVYKFILVAGSIFYRSIDGTNWISNAATTPYGLNGFRIFNTNSTSNNPLVYCPYYSKYYCAILPTTAANNTVIMSDDTVTWTQCSGTGGLSGFWLSSISYDNTGVIIANGNRPSTSCAFRSTNGSSFTSFNFTSGGATGSTTYIVDRFMCCNNSFNYSINRGVDWVSNSLTMRMVDYSPELNMLIGTDTGINRTYYYSYDLGVSWTTATLPSPSTPPSTTWNAFGNYLIKWCNPKWVISVHTNVARPYTTSSNGITWDGFKFPTSALRRIAGFYAFTN